MKKIFYTDGELNPGYDQVDEFLSDLVDAKICAVGFHPASKEGGLGFDYYKFDKEQNKIIKKRLVIGFNDLGMWCDWCGELNDINEKDVQELKNKLQNFVDYFNENVQTNEDRFFIRVNQEKETEVIFKNFSFTLSGKDLNILGDDFKKNLEEFGHQPQLDCGPIYQRFLDLLCD